MDDSDEVDIDLPALLTNELLPATIAPKSTDTETNTDIYHPTLPCHSIVSRSRGLFHWAVRAVAMTTRNCDLLSSLGALWELLRELTKSAHTYIRTQEYTIN